MLARIRLRSSEQNRTAERALFTAQAALGVLACVVSALVCFVSIFTLAYGSYTASWHRASVTADDTLRGADAASSGALSKTISLLPVRR